MMISVRTLVVAAALMALVALPSSACLNDRDTLANEANRYPNVLQTITGRFERNPPLYYQMRIQRVTAELKADPSIVADYDDVGVANDRIGKDDEAIAWMDRKLDLLKKSGDSTADLKEQWYRYYANTGTFWMHRWVRAGADRGRIDAVVHARDLIQHALDIKPDAHFGREKYQLKVMSWVIEGSGRPLADYLRYDMSGSPLPYNRRMEPVTALCGIVVLGSAWESVDIFDAISTLLYRNSMGGSDGRRLAYLANLRCQELIDTGHGSLVPDRPTGEALKKTLLLSTHGFEDPDGSDVGNYRILRTEADRWQIQRTNYMMLRLKAGDHPDTDAKFWAGFRDDGPPHIANTLDEAIYLAMGKPFGMEFFLFWLLFWLVASIVGWVGAKWVVCRWRRRRGAPVASTGPDWAWGDKIPDAQESAGDDRDGRGGG